LEQEDAMPHNSPEPTECDQAIPWRESRHFDDPIKLPSQIMAGARYREGLTQAEPSRRTGIFRQHIPQMENGHTPISEADAQKIATVLNINPQHLLAP
jgi:DNA-binding XRE family transcriptional regulator